MTTRTRTRTPTPRLHSIQTSGRHFGAMRVLPSAPTDEDTGRSSALARRLDQAAQFAPRSHKGPDLPRSAVVHTGHYEGAELAPYTGRPGAMAAHALPSRMGDRLHYRDGRVETVGAA